MRTSPAEDSTTVCLVLSEPIVVFGLASPLRYFINDIALVAHFKTPKHRRRLKQALDGTTRPLGLWDCPSSSEPHTQEVAEAAVGYGRV